MDIRGSQKHHVDDVPYLGFVGIRVRKLVLLIADIGMNGPAELPQSSISNINVWGLGDISWRTGSIA